MVLAIVTIMSTVFFEKLFQFSKSTEGIENSNKAYYKALGAIEASLYTGGVNKYTPWNISKLSQGNVISSGARLNVTTGSTTVPAPGKGNSQYDRDYNIIALGSPVQLVIPN